EEPRRVRHRDTHRDRRVVQWNRAADVEARHPGQAAHAHGRLAAGRVGDDVVVDGERGGKWCQGDGGAGADGRAGRDRQPHRVLVQLQRADPRRVFVDEVVPHPAVAERFAAEGGGVGDEAAGDGSDAGVPESRGPVREDAVRHAVGRAEARVAGAGDHEVALEHAVVDRAGGADGRGVGVVPAEGFGGRGERHDLHVRRGHEQPAGVQRVERLVVFQPHREDAPVAAREGRVGEDGVDVALQGADGGGGGRRRRNGMGRLRSAGGEGHAERNENFSDGGTIVPRTEVPGTYLVPTWYLPGTYQVRTWYRKPCE